MAFRPVDHQGVTLAVGLQSNSGPQVLHGCEVLNPVVVDGPEQQQPLYGAQLFCANVLFPCLVDCLREIDQYLLNA